MIYHNIILKMRQKSGITTVNPQLFVIARSKDMNSVSVGTIYTDSFFQMELFRQAHSACLIMSPQDINKHNVVRHLTM